MNIKRIYDFTDAELMALTPEEVKTLIDYECALEGVPLLPPEPVKPNYEKPKPDLEVFEISSSNAYFTSAAEVADILSLMNKANKVRYTYTGNTLHAMKPDGYGMPKYEAKMIYSEDFFAKIKEEMQTNKQAEDTYTQAKKEYDQGYTSRKDIVAKIHADISAAFSRKYEWDKFAELFTRYLGIANGDKQIAWKFLKQAYNQVTGIEGFEEAMIGQPEAVPANIDDAAPADIHDAE